MRVCQPNMISDGERSQSVSFRAAPYFHDVIVIYILMFGQHHEQVMESLRAHGQTWMVWYEPMSVRLAVGHSGPIRDQPVSPRGAIIASVPLKRPRTTPRVVGDLRYWRANGTSHRVGERPGGGAWCGVSHTMA